MLRQVWNQATEPEGGETNLELLKRLVLEEDGQGLVEYTLIVLLVALVFWVAIKNTNIGSALAGGWSSITACVTSPTACTSSS
jgi:Flp pilus assembly pilin Flp